MIKILIKELWCCGGLRIISGLNTINFACYFVFVSANFGQKSVV